MSKLAVMTVAVLALVWRKSLVARIGKGYMYIDGTCIIHVVVYTYVCEGVWIGW